MQVLIVISLLLLSLYIYKVLIYRYYWNRYPESEPPEPDLSVWISVIIAFRNERQHLPVLLSSLAVQVYPSTRYEVILVNDHSHDGSDGLVQQFCRDHAQFRLLHNDPGSAGKKAAITRGVLSASGELIVTTDADCSMGPYWLTALAGIYVKHHADMVVGLVDLQTGDSFLEGFQQAEFTSLVASGAAALAGGRSLYCNGANLAYNRNVFLSHKDPLQQQVTSGEDTLFLHLLKRNRKSRIILAKTRAAIVNTTGVSSWQAFREQRKRWVSKSLHYRDIDTLYTAVLVLLVNMVMLVSLAWLATGRNFWWYPLLFGGKTLAEGLFLQSYLGFYDRKLPMIRFLVYAWIYPFYAGYFAITGLFSDFHWKGRSYRTNFPVPT
jgi:glycosyltransferase involved in cell wall biosynthesis